MRRRGRRGAVAVRDHSGRPSRPSLRVVACALAACARACCCVALSALPAGGGGGHFIFFLLDAPPAGRRPKARSAPQPSRAACAAKGCAARRRNERNREKEGGQRKDTCPEWLRMLESCWLFGPAVPSRRGRRTVWSASASQQNPARASADTQREESRTERTAAEAHTAPAPSTVHFPNRQLRSEAKRTREGTPTRTDRTSPAHSASTRSQLAATVLWILQSHRSAHNDSNRSHR